MQKYKRFMLWVMALYIFWIILLFSSQNAKESSAESLSVIEKAVIFLEKLGFNTLTNIFNQLIASQIFKIQKLVRKLAHFFNFSVLGCLYTGLTGEYQKGKWILIKSITLGLIAAIIDETYQGFIPGRSAQVTDVITDLSGVFTGAMFVLFFLNKDKKSNLFKCRTNPSRLHLL